MWPRDALRPVLACTLLGLVGGPLGCEDPDPACVGVQPVGLVIAVLDGDTSATLCDAQVHLTHAEYEEDLTADDIDPCRYLGAHLAGEYAIEVSREGYESRRLTATVQATGSCPGVETQELEVTLTPEG